MRLCSCAIPGPATWSSPRWRLCTFRRWSVLLRCIEGRWHLLYRVRCDGSEQVVVADDAPCLRGTRERILLLLRQERSVPRQPHSTRRRRLWPRQQLQDRHWKADYCEGRLQREGWSLCLLHDHSQARIGRPLIGWKLPTLASSPD